MPFSFFMLEVSGTRITTGIPLLLVSFQIESLVFIKHVHYKELAWPGEFSFTLSDNLHLESVGCFAFAVLAGREA